MSVTIGAPTVSAFVARWNRTSQAERANHQLFLAELCAILGVAPSEPASGSQGAYRFERGVVRHEPDGRKSPRRIDLYKRGCFILEAKQGASPVQAPCSRRARKSVAWRCGDRPGAETEKAEKTVVSFLQ